jgi:hypothetical protein
MGFRDQVRKFLGRIVRVQTVDGCFIGCLVAVKENTIILRGIDQRRRTIIRIVKIVAITEFRHERERERLHEREHEREDCDD